MELKRQKEENVEMQSLKKELDKMNITVEKEASRIQEMETALEEKEGEKLTLLREIDELKEKLANSSEGTKLLVLKLILLSCIFLKDLYNLFLCHLVYTK